MVDVWMLYSTFKSRDEAIFAAKTLLAERLIACANITEGMTSLYRWEGKIQQENEVVLVAKTAADKAEAAIARLKALNSYELPCAVAWVLEKGHVPFLKWVNDETSGKKLE